MTASKTFAGAGVARVSPWSGGALARTAPDSVSPAAAPAPRAARFTGTGGELGRRVLTFEVLQLLTLGIYRFWAKTHLRRYLWSRVRLDGDPFEYHGTPLELFKGFVIAFVVLAPALVAHQVLVLYVFADDMVASQIVSAAFLVGMFVLWPVAQYRALVYQAGRTSWRGLRLSLRGSALRYAALWLGWGTVSVATMGFAWPWMQAATGNYIVNNLRYGGVPFRAEVRGWEIFHRTAWMHVLAVLIFPLYWVFMMVARVRALRVHTSRVSIGPVRFASTMSGGAPVRGLLWTVLAGVAVYGAALAPVGYVFADEFAAAVAADGEPALNPGLFMGFVAAFMLAGILVRALHAKWVVARCVRAYCDGLKADGLAALEARAVGDGGGRHGEGLADALGGGAF